VKEKKLKIKHWLQSIPLLLENSRLNC